MSQDKADLKARILGSIKRNGLISLSSLKDNLSRYSSRSDVQCEVERLIASGEICRDQSASGKLRIQESVARRDEPQHESAIEQKFGDDDGSISYRGREIQTPEQLLEHCNIDRNIWEIADATVNNWEVGGVKKTGQDEEGNWRPEELWKMPLLQIKVRLRRKAPKPIQEGIRGLLEELRLKPVKLPAVGRSRLKDPHLLEVSLYDAHFGKLCWGEQTGTNYDLDIAKSDYVHAVDDLLNKVGQFSIEKVVLPIGHDFFQVNNWLGTTVKGTRVDQTDDRFQKVFRVGCKAVEYAVRRCREVADVEVKWVGGNHDLETSWYMSEWLTAVFHYDKNVVVDNCPKGRKYMLYGPTLLGYSHGDMPNIDKLPLLMAAEEPVLWGKSTYREWRTGHLHKKKEVKHTAGDTFNGVRVVILPSLSGTDKWHYDMGFVGSSRTAECHLWSKKDGPAGYFTTIAKSAA